MIHFDSHLLRKDEPYYLAFSGGIDSLASSHFLSKGGYQFDLVHVNHRCIAADIGIAIEAAVSAKRLGFNAVILHSPVEWSGRGSAEAYCHDVRYKLFSDLDRTVIICHHLNDLAEGYLMNCIRGNPLKIPLLARAVVKGADIVRPFLRTKKDDFEQYAHQAGIANLVVPEVLPSERQILRDKVIPYLQSDLTTVSRKLFIDTNLIYQSNTALIG